MSGDVRSHEIRCKSPGITDGTSLPEARNHRGEDGATGRRLVLSNRFRSACVVGVPVLVGHGHRGGAVELELEVEVVVDDAANRSPCAVGYARVLLFRESPDR